MKRIITVCFVLAALISNSFAQTDTVRTDTLWKVEGYGGINLNQVSFTNWAAGGENAISFSMIGLMAAKYKKDRHSWDNLLNMNYGVIWTKTDGMRKNEDKLELESKYGYALDKKRHWSLSVLGNFKSQFAPGYNYPNDSLVISKFAAPGYLTLALGIDYKPTDYFSLFMSPVTARILFVRDQDIANTGVYSNEGGTPIFDSTGTAIIGYSTLGEKTRFDFGGYLSAKFNKEVVKNVTIMSKLDVFANYTGETSDAKVPDVSWENAFLFKVNEWLSASLTLHLIYDKEIMIPKDENDNGEFELNEFGSRVQFREALSLGLTYKFRNKNVPAPK